MTDDRSLASELYQLTAAQVVALLGRGEVSPLELVDAAVARIEVTDRHLNALPTLCVDRARDHARRIMKHGRPDGDGPWLGGLPLAIKDLNEVAGVRTTFGSPIFAHHVPERSDILVETLEARGGIVLAKSNTPEFGAGASMFNEVLGKTRNPWNTDKSVAGSSGGGGACARRALSGHRAFLRELRLAALSDCHRAAVRRGRTLCRRGPRPRVRQLRALARAHVRSHPHGVPGALGPGRDDRGRSPGRPADHRPAPGRSAHPRRRRAAGAHERARREASDRSTRRVGTCVGVKHGLETAFARYASRDTDSLHIGRIS